jgi:hypothetical protein
MAIQITYSLLHKNGRPWIQYLWQEHAERCTACFLRTPGLPPGQAEQDWILRITKNAEYSIRPGSYPDGRSPRPAGAGRRTSLDTLETSVNANLFDSL